MSKNKQAMRNASDPGDGTTPRLSRLRTHTQCKVLVANVLSNSVFFLCPETFSKSSSLCQSRLSGLAGQFHDALDTGVPQALQNGAHALTTLA